MKRAINRSEETKHVGINSVDAAFNSTISSASECYALMPAVTEGSSGCQRDGNKIKPKYLIVKGHLQYDEAYLANGNYTPPSTVRVLILTQKNIKSRSDISRVDVDHLLKDNVGVDTARGYTSTIFDNLAPINKDLFKVLMDRKFKMKAIMRAELGNSGFRTIDGTERTHTFSVKIKCPANLFFDDGNGDFPNNFCPFICMGAVNDGGNAAYTLSTPYHLTVQSELYFTDA